MNSSLKKKLVISLFASLSLGLAPFFPEPHLVGKWRWVLGGAQGMSGMDWFDWAMHSAPWVFLLYFTGKAIFQKKSPSKSTSVKKETGR